MKLFEVFQGLLVGRKFDTFRQLNVENIDIQSSFGGDFRVKLPQRTGSSIPGICK